MSSDNYLGVRIIGENTYLSTLTIIPDNCTTPPNIPEPFSSSSSSGIDQNAVVDGGDAVVDGGIPVVDSPIQPITSSSSSSDVVTSSSFSAIPDQYEVTDSGVGFNGIYTEYTDEFKYGTYNESTFVVDLFTGGTRRVYLHNDDTPWAFDSRIMYWQSYGIGFWEIGLTVNSTTISTGTMSYDPGTGQTPPEGSWESGETITKL